MFKCMLVPLALGLLLLSGCLQAKVAWPTDSGSITAEYKAMLWATKLEDFIYDPDTGIISIGNYASATDEESVAYIADTVRQLSNDLAELLLLLK